MSGDVQPRKRKDKKKKKDGADDVQSNFSSEEIMHSHKDVGTGGNMCTKIIFYSLLGALLVMIGIILLDQRGLTDLDSSDGDSQWAPIFQGWLEDPPSHDDDHLKTTDSGEEDHGDDDHEHDSGIEDEDDEHEHEDEEEEEEENEDEHSGGDEEEDENEDEHSGGDEEEDEGLDDDLDEDDEQDIKKDEYSQEIDDSKEEDDEGEEDDDVGNDDDDDVDEEEGEDDDDEGEEDDVGKNDDKDEKEDDEIENFNGDKNQEEDEEGEDEEEQDHDDDDNDDIEDNILFREIPGVVESSEDVEEGNTNGEDLNDSSEDMQDDVKASGEKNDDQVRKMADRSSNINNAAHVVEPHITLQTSDDMKMDLNFKKPVEETKTKESIGVSMEKPHTLSKEPTKQTSRPSKSREKPEDHTQKIDDKIVDSIRPSTGDVTTTDKKPESSYKSSTISPKTSDNTKDKLDTGKASEINIESEKPLRVIDNHKKEQDKRQQNYQKVNENKLHETKVVNNADKQRSDKLNKVSEKPLRTTDTHQKGQDLKQQNYQKVSEETKTASSSSGKKVTETKPVNKAEKQPSDQKIKDDSNTNSVPKKPISNERETSGSKMEDSRIGVNDKSTTEHEKEKQPSDQMKKDDSKTDYVPMKPESNEKEIPSSRTEKYSKIGASDESTTKHKNEKQSTDETKKEDSNSNSLPQKPVSNEKEIPSSKKEKDSIIQTSDKSTVEHQTVDLKSNQKPSLDKTNAGDFSKNHKPVVQTSPEINTKKEGKLTDLEHDKQTHRVSSELNMEKTVKQNPGKVSEQQHNDKLKKEKNEKLNNVIDKSSVYKRDDSQQGKVPSGNDKTVKTEKVKKNVASQAPDKSHQTAKSKLEPDENEDKDEDGDSGIEADETDTIGVALKFGVGVALVIVAHVVLVRKWNSDEDTVPPQTPTVPSPRISAEVPRIVETSAEQEDFVEDEPEKSITSELVVRRQTLLPEELAQSFENRKREDSASSGGTEEDIEDDGQEVRIFKMNVLSAELPVKEERSFKDEKPFKEDRMFKVESFEELMKKYRQLTPEGSDLEYEDEEEEEEDGAELDEEEVDEEEEEEDLEDDEDNLPEQTLPGKPNITTMKNIRDHESNSEDEEVEEDYDDDKQSKLKMENESEDDESEEEDEEDEEEDEEEDGQELFRQKEKQKPSYSKYQQNISDEEDTDERPAPTLSKFSKGPGGEKAQNYVNYDITSDDDWNLIDELDKAAAEKPEVAIFMFDLILKSHPNSPRAWYGKATALDQLAEMQQSNHILEQAIEAFKKVVALGPAVKDKLLLQAAQRCIERMRFKGQHLKAVAVHQALISRFPNNSQFQNQLAVTYLMINRIQEAKRVLEKVLQNWKNDGFAQVHYGFILKTSGNNLEEAVKYLRNGIATREPGTIDGRFFFQLGDALQRLGRKDEAMEVYEMGVQEKLFLSKYQRSLYNVDRLRAQPWWTPEQTTYVTLFNTLKNKWTEIRREGLTAFYEKDINLFQDESENLKDSGKWQQLELYARGRKIQKNCLKAPLTCQLIDAFPMARDCKRGQVKFSVMHAGTHVWPHCGPTNCRLRSHLGLVVPSGTYIRVADETRSWKEGDFIIFDDSFEHEVWHNGTSTRLVLIVDVWHPELSEEEKRTMAAI